MPTRRQKSLADIRQQSYRLQNALFNVPVPGTNQMTTTNNQRVQRVLNATQRYSSNIRKAINARNGTPGDYPLYGEDFNRKVSRSTYMGLNAG